MNELLEEIKYERLLEHNEWVGSAHGDVHEPEKSCSLLHHQVRLTRKVL